MHDTKTTTNPSTAGSPRHRDFQDRLDELRVLCHHGGYGDPYEVSLAEQLYRDLHTSRVIVQSILGSASSADVMEMFKAMQQWSQMYHQ